MDKYMTTPLRNYDNDCGRPLVEKNTPKEEKKEDEEIILEKVAEKCQLPSEIVSDKSNKIKKLKVKKCRGEKRKFPDKLDSKKIKRKKKEEKPEDSASVNNFNEEVIEIDVLKTGESTSLSNISKSKLKKEFSTGVDNDSDVENHKKSIKPRHSRKNKAIANKCKETLDVLIKLGLEVLDSMEKSLKIIKSHSLLSDKHISLDILLELISLALATSKGPEVVDSEKESSLSVIITKCTEELYSTPRRSKTRPSLVTVPVSPQNVSLIQEEDPSSIAISKEIVEKQTKNNQESVEIMQPCKTIECIEGPEKSQEPAKSGNNFCITNYFKKLKKIVEERDKNERFSCFTTKTDMFLAPKLGGELTGERRQKFEEEFYSQNFEFSYLTENIRKHKYNNKSSEKAKLRDRISGTVENTNKSSSHNLVEGNLKQSSSDETEISEGGEVGSKARKRVSLIRVDKPKLEPTEAVCRASKAKLLQFHDNRRPPYWGTWRRKSDCVGPRRPFGRDKMFNYEIDSDDEWEEEEEPGESLHGSDEEKEPEEDYEVDNEFFVPHGYLSDDENPEKESLSPKTKLNLLEEQFTSEQKQKMRKMTPIIFGTFWMYKGIPFEGNLYQDLQIDKLQYVPWVTIPVEIEEEKKKSDNHSDQGEPTSQLKKSKQKIFPNEEIPNLIKMIHGSPQNSDQLARKFLDYWEAEKTPNGNRPGLTKVCIQKKIKELATKSHEKGKTCWKVPKETREEFGAEVENKTPEKKPQMCFIWKFVRKAEKNSSAGKPPAPEGVEPKVVILESEP